MDKQATLTAGEALVRLLAEYGVDTVFGIPGVHTLELYRGLPGSGIRHVLTRHEQGAGFMADGYARVTGKPGVCFLISGPGVTNACTPIGQAYADSVPMLVITSVNATETLAKGHGCLHETQDQRAITAPITAFSALALRPEDLPELVAQAFAVFEGERPRPVHISIPLDVLSAPVAHDWSRQTVVLPGPGPASSAAIDQAAARLRQAQRPMILAGGGALKAQAEIRALAESLDAVVFTTVAGKGMLPVTHPLNAGATLCVPPGWDLIAQADLVLAVGTEMAETDFWRERLPLQGDLLRIDLDGRKFNDVYPATVALKGDARQTLQALLQALSGRPSAATGAAAAVRALQQRVRAEHGPLQQIHQSVLDVVARVWPADGVICADMTQIGYTGNYALPSAAVRSWFHPTGYGTLGYALPAGIGARIGAPDRPGLVLVGDGGFLYTVQELATAVEELTQPFVVLLWNNHALGQIRDDMVDLSIEPIGVLPRNPDFLGLAAAFGCATAQPRSLDQLEQSLKDALAHPGVTLVQLDHQDLVQGVPHA